jgi:hypothetical protein
MCINNRKILIEKTINYDVIKVKSFNEKEFNEKFEKKFKIDSSDPVIIKRFVMIEKSGRKGTFPFKSNAYIDYVFKTKIGTNLAHGFAKHPGTGTLESLEETVAYYEDIERAVEFLKK